MKRIQVRVRPNARQEAFEERSDGTWVAAVKAPPVDGKANAALVRLIASHFGVPRSRVSIRSGAGGRMKLVQVDRR